MENKCSCGYDINHPKVIHKCEYSKIGWFLLTILGLSAKPKSIEFICSVCNMVLFKTNDPAILKKYIGR